MSDPTYEEIYDVLFGDLYPGVTATALEGAAKKVAELFAESVLAEKQCDLFIAHGAHDHVGKWCPGIKAHPDVMIGRRS